MSYAELAAASNFSFLRGASPPSDMVWRAITLGYTAIGIADRNTVAGVVRAYAALRDAPEQAMADLLEAKRAAGRPAELTPEEEADCQIDLRLLVGARLVFADGTPDIIAYPATRHGWGRLTRLLTAGNLKAVKGDCILSLDDLVTHLDDLLLIVLPESTAVDQQAHPKPVDYDVEPADPPVLRAVATPPRELGDLLALLSAKAPDRVWLGAAMTRSGKDARRLDRLARIAAAARVPLIAIADALYATPDQRPLHDVLTCIREGTTLAEAGRRLEANAERHLKSPAEMARLFASHPQAIDETLRFAARIGFTLDQLRYEYPREPVPDGWDPQEWLEHLVWQNALERYDYYVPPKSFALLQEECTLIRELGYANYFLTVHDLVKFARSQDPPILCQGRGSAANSIVCFLLGVTSVDPNTHDLLFSRFISTDRKEPPDIDVDFEHERREEVMQYVYRRYGRHRAGIASTVIHYRSRSAVREVAKVLGLSEDVSTKLASTVWGSYSGDMEDRRFTDAGFALDNAQIVRLRFIMTQLLEAPFPRHLSQHVGGFVLTQDRLDETVPIHHGAMDERSFIEWDKDDIDALGLMKVDVLALGMLTCIRKSYDLMRRHGLGDHDLELDLESDDPAVYAMLQKGDSVGVFQVESRAQMNMLPRLKPKCLYDLTVQVAIVRPGPIQGDMVHPYLRRRAEIEKVDYPSPKPPHDPQELRELLGKTYGVPLFQEQAMKLAIVAAGFTPSEANQLRRAMATFRNLGGMDKFETKMVEGMVARGYERDFAHRCFKQIEGFGSYGFPESHALSFARLVYVSSWVKCHHPAVFACALLNSQPMGFYAPAQIVRDAREHGVEVRAIDVNASDWDNRLEPTASRHAGLGHPSKYYFDGNRLVPASTVPQLPPPPEEKWTPEQVRGDERPQHGFALRLGFRQIDGFRQAWADTIAAARAYSPFTAIEDLARRAALPPRALRLLADADGFRSIGLDRRAALWEVRRTPTGELPLFAAARARELGQEKDTALPMMSPAEHVVADYQTTRLSLKNHPMSFLRATLRDEGISSCAESSRAKNDSFVRTAGIVLVRQRPGNGKAIFITIEDESGVTNIVLWARQFERYRRAVMASRLLLAEGRVQRSVEGVVHLMATRVIDRTELLDQLSEDGKTPTTLSRADEFLHPQHPRAPLARISAHPRQVRVLPRSRDFH
ncbi:DNA polymerase III subunit alpha [Sphingomonas koreensis]|nr:DNA polymerase III subunit alpha [Sphingomonas koreensis]